MELVIQSLILVASLAVIAKSAHIVIDNSVKLARITRLGEVAIGFILLSVVTNLPEAAIALSSVLSGRAGIAIGNIFGSNIADMCLVIGVMAKNLENK